MGWNGWFCETMVSGSTLKIGTPLASRVEWLECCDVKHCSWSKQRVKATHEVCAVLRLVCLGFCYTIALETTKLRKMHFEVTG